MGHREQLLAGAKRCLLERGYARTTARDIVEASGANLASIGYHFGSKEALLNAAMIEAMNEWGDELERVITVDAAANPLDRLESIWTAVVESISAHRQLWAATIDGLTQASRHPELRDRLAAAFEGGRSSFGPMILARDTGAGDGDNSGDGNVRRAGAGDQDAQTAVGSLVMAVITGLTVQWILDPEHAPSGHDLTAALRTILTTAQPTTRSQ
jgi:AcrR family transcriptional regulator